MVPYDALEGAGEELRWPCWEEVEERAFGDGSLDRMRDESASLSRLREVRSWREEVMELRVWARRASEGFEDMAGREDFE